MPRSAANDFTFAGFRVERGESAMVFTSACHFDRAYFPDPERFDIDRYQPEPLSWLKESPFSLPTVTLWFGVARLSW